MRHSRWAQFAGKGIAPIAALEQAIAERKPLPGLVHHSDCEVQYAPGDYVKILRKHEMIPSMSRPANPSDAASCESFLKTLKREETHANHYRDLEYPRAHIAVFIERAYNRLKIASSSCRPSCRSPERAPPSRPFDEGTFSTASGLAMPM